LALVVGTHRPMQRIGESASQSPELPAPAQSKSATTLGQRLDAGPAPELARQILLGTVHTHQQLLQLARHTDRPPEARK
jgi:hypothetical protein